MLGFRVTDDLADIDAAALIWAETTAARDHDSQVAPLEQARPLIQSVLASSPRSLLLVASDNTAVVGFAAIEPWSSDNAVAEVRYVGVSPRTWGRGIGRHLMQAVHETLASAGFPQAILMVYADNTPAIRLYERLGWCPHGRPVPHPRTGKPEQQYRLDLSSR
jgi:ribosomal protein S18 acetylase RimI-like enzyme